MLDTFVTVGYAGEGSEAGGRVVQLGRGNGGGAERRTVAEAARIEHRAEPADETLLTALVKKRQHIRLVAADLVGQRLERPSAKRNPLLKQGQ